MENRRTCVIFDLDGTLLNTIADLGTACNYALQQCGLPEHAPADYPGYVGNGINKLIERAIGSEDSAISVEQVKPYFLAYYNRHCCDMTQPYEGIMGVLQTLKKQGVTLALASNKYQQATETIVQHFFPGLFDIVEGEREGRPRKPNPQIVQDIMRQLSFSSRDGVTGTFLYVGDSQVDIETAHNAGLPVAACTWGFATREVLKTAQPDWLIEAPQEILTVWAEKQK